MSVSGAHVSGAHCRLVVPMSVSGAHCRLVVALVG